jgi:hypothetical protein
MSDTAPFGVPGTEMEWLRPEDEQKTLRRLDSIREEQERSGFTSIEDTAWLTLTARKLLEARIATRAAVIANAQRVRDLEQGQGILGDDNASDDLWLGIMARISGPFDTLDSECREEAIEANLLRFRSGIRCWSNRRPIFPGFYWFRESENHAAGIIELYRDQDTDPELSARYPDGHETYVLNLTGQWFYIPRPPKP